ncbi:helix-turn-helix transcriptional regulator [Loigolactobacillus coryniformis]|jgi:DNA-binding CsgD family transcriptional regulator|uniref:HTH cro/C1-type domain-containing protein n=2 Tax=Loigolactobacillus coryniformis TaxID=1610 RepID=A0A0R1F7Z9_9LACO|nr:helix-turn-helix transcriptional regulator [Loigolactobacillus coryniformis]OEH89140.1 DNA-binding protein [Loigolactobacillus coryniformis subsp. coryniformis]RRG05276.1 MAG: XRE family transcriptional regulator [Lactobacillus sp.]ATO56608.1 transcriptional regulator [Loigolactobacillus coryniformis subsp. coryniformis KCTC 3167 = DSM 20001]KRK15274.1 hypothetical protein FD22_GL001822 [Loigolactobacillus coryniformis subsp. coryniformis KCTC 3167 = DSM 20001]MBW4801530.1 helix-turn-helix 
MINLNESAGKQLDLTDSNAVAAALKHYGEIIETYASDDQRSMVAGDAQSALIYDHIPIRVYHLMLTQLDHTITYQETAALIVASYTGKDISEVLDLSPEVKLALKFQIARRQAKMTQKEVAAKVGNINQSQIARAERVNTMLSLSQWASLFAAIKTPVTLRLY